MDVRPGTARGRIAVPVIGRMNVTGTVANFDTTGAIIINPWDI
jgi:hypothetical protein